MVFVLISGFPLACTSFSPSPVSSLHSLRHRLSFAPALLIFWSFWSFWSFWVFFWSFFSIFVPFFDCSLQADISFSSTEKIPKFSENNKRENAPSADFWQERDGVGGTGQQP
jgi:hypothetical protein